MKNNFFEPIIRMVRPEEIDVLVKTAENDKHATVRPTHVVVKNDEIVGHISLGSVPMVLLWMDTTKTDVYDSRCVSNFIENMGRSDLICVPVPEASPYHKLMEKGGYRAVCKNVTLFMKQL